MKSLKKLSRPYKVARGKHFRLADYDPADAGPDALRRAAAELLPRSVEQIASLQEKLYAQDKWAVLLIFQALDAAGKDSVIKHVMSGLNPQSCDVHSFKVPSAEENDHDFLWRTMKALPRRGHIGIFNRSHYEEVLVVRVHPEFLAAQQLPPSLVTRHIWPERCEDINNVERYLSRQGTVIRKFFLHVSRDEQKKRFLERLDQPEKNWKFSATDVRERAWFKDYMAAYEAAIRATATPWAPWYVVPADHKWFTRLVVASAVIEALEELQPEFPTLDGTKRRELLTMRQVLIDEDRH
jgi:PPK2 family polyphosphate:nucleotide phosphotransferase